MHALGSNETLLATLVSYFYFHNIFLSSVRSWTRFSVSRLYRWIIYAAFIKACIEAGISV